MGDRLSKLINVKSIVTLLTTLTFCYMSIDGRISDSEFITIFTTIIAFYFGTQTNKKGANDD